MSAFFQSDGGLFSTDSYESGGDDFWDSMDDLTQYQEDTSVYLTDASKGLELIAKVYRGRDSRDQQAHTARIIKSKIEHDLLGAFGKSSEQDVGFYKTLQEVSSKILEQASLPELTGKTVVGVGGMFSAGKSMFLNAITDCASLPTCQSPTTAIATYLVKGEKAAIKAFTSAERAVLLNEEEMQAISHAFYEKYKLGFSSVIEKLVHISPDFPFDKLALLDTPGYNNADNGETESNESGMFSQDALLAQRYLTHCDILMWLVNAENGTVQKSDLDFLRSLNKTKPCLVVFTKADKRRDEVLEKLIEEAKTTFQRENISIWGVTAYSSVEKEEALGKSLIPEFLKEAESLLGDTESVEKQLFSVEKKWEKSIDDKINTLKKDRWNIESIIQEVTAPQYLSSMASLYQDMQCLGTKLYYDKKRFTYEFGVLERSLRGVMRSSYGK